MAKIEKFEDILAWQKARELTQLVYRASRKGEFAKDFALRDQIRRAVISITSNIAEGFERGGTKEFVQFLGHAKGSCGEVRSQLYIALDEAYLSHPIGKNSTTAASKLAASSMALPNTSDKPRSKAANSKSLRQLETLNLKL